MMAVELKKDYSLKVKIELINDGFLIYSPTGIQFKENLVDAVSLALEEIEDWSVEIFRVPFCEEEAEELKQIIKEKREKLKSEKL